ncbi:JAB domain-containing protein [Pseudoflavitalea rhizosphaerae]|uniref:JAB domain-containing protein n=1 Tax=Pseudoflavitalea rhizosphaerae TaxID=1884793 RepID=UPI000F8CB1C2|nr:JAB domain-containing protein [Pseudoflavitalea rhizosphaerae]
MKEVLKQVSELKLSYSPKVKPSDREKITSSKDAYKIFLESWDEATIYLTEQCKVMLLNRANRVVGIHTLSIGGVTGSIVDPRIVFALTLVSPANQLILCHNHPSGNLTPSEQDIKITKKLKEAGSFLDIEVVDHLIISPEGYYSFSDNGLI